MRPNTRRAARVARVALAPVLLLLGACVAVPSGSPGAPVDPALSPTGGSRDFLYAEAWFADPVFDNDVATFARAFATGPGAPAASALFGNSSPSLARPGGGAGDAALARLAAEARDGVDVVTVMLTTHGRPEALAVQRVPGGPVSDATGAALRATLAPLSRDLQIVILQACYSGSLIDDIAAPNRIVMTAARADRSSFGCQPDSANTWFIESMNEALVQGGSWEEVFALTRTFVAREEARAGLVPSEPQVFVGAAMQEVWTAPF